MPGSIPSDSFKRVYDDVKSGDGLDEPLSSTSAPRVGAPLPDPCVLDVGRVLAFSYSSVLEQYVSNMAPEPPVEIEPFAVRRPGPTEAELIARIEALGSRRHAVGDLKSLRRELARMYHPDLNRELDSGMMTMANARLDALIAIARGRSGSVE